MEKSFVGGKLRLKGSKLSPTNPKKRKRDETTESSTTSSTSESLAESPQKLVASGDESSNTPQPVPKPKKDMRTEAQKAHDRALEKLIQTKKQIQKLASKSHREKIEEFNNHLAKLSEHHDIPRVGPG